MLCELRITKGVLIEELHRKGILGKGAAPSRRLVELEKVNSMILRVETALPARPQVNMGSCDLTDPTWQLPIHCLKAFLAYADADSQPDTAEERRDSPEAVWRT
jgi:hypothetical protein